MLKFTRTNDSFTNKEGRLEIKVLVYGKNDVQTPSNIAPFGIDSNPIKGMVAVYGETSVDGEPVIIGYINENVIAEKGETHIYSTDENGVEKFRIKVKKDGTCEIGGDSDNAMRYTPLNAELQSFISTMQGELVKIASGIATGGGSYTPATLSIDISGSKIDEIKVP